MANIAWKPNERNDLINSMPNSEDTGIEILDKLVVKTIAACGSMRALSKMVNPPPYEYSNMCDAIERIWLANIYTHMRSREMLTGNSRVVFERSVQRSMMATIHRYERLMLVDTLLAEVELREDIYHSITDGHALYLDLISSGEFTYRSDEAEQPTPES